jgi:hypothetical protein
MLLEKGYESEIQKYLAIKNERNFFSELEYSIFKDKNVQWLFELMEKYGNYSIEDMDDNYRIEIITSGFSRELEYLAKLIGVFYDAILDKNSYLFKDVSAIDKCCNIFSDNTGSRIIKLIGIYPIVKQFVKIDKLYDNSRGLDNPNTVQEIKNILGIINLYYTSVHDKELLLEYVELQINEERNKSLLEYQEFSKSMTEVINNIMKKEEEC